MDRFPFVGPKILLADSNVLCDLLAISFSQKMAAALMLQGGLVLHEQWLLERPRVGGTLLRESSQLLCSNIKLSACGLLFTAKAVCQGSSSPDELLTNRTRLF